LLDLIRLPPPIVIPPLVRHLVVLKLEPVDGPLTRCPFSLQVALYSVEFVVRVAKLLPRTLEIKGR